MPDSLDPAPETQNVVLVSADTLRRKAHHRLRGLQSG
jgi:hypothetical protein